VGAGGNAGNCYKAYCSQFDNDAVGKLLGPMNGTWKSTVFDGSAWTETDTYHPWFALILDSAYDPFVIPAQPRWRKR
jgi:hypothetical protein